MTDDDDDLSEQLIPDPDPVAVSYSTTDFDVEGLVRRQQRGDIVIPTFGEDLDDPPIETARFQRPLVWLKSQMDRFIESLLLGYPIPGIFLVKQEDKRYLVLDGQQRLRTLRAFYEGLVFKREFALKNVGDRFVGLTYKTLSVEQRRQIDNTFIQATVVQTTPAQNSFDAIYQVFERLNAGGTQLTPHEIRVALYAGPFIEWLTGLSSTSEWRNLYGPAPRHLRDQELVLRILALYIGFETYKRPLKKYLNDFVDGHRELQSIDTTALGNRFRAAAGLLFEAGGLEVLRPGGTAVNAAWTEALFIGLMARLERTTIELDDVRDAVTALLNDRGMASAITRATADLESVKTRVSKSREAFGKSD
ncbi:DUF262 domain-containing protein [Curtobacterium sp. Leaf261]|uniref:DUF262 domain-containing protein n=1 Tax=Curtobacterium sp. Leaf261 TaxID=1736311 RepID=UPI0009E752C6|nr:DUF262 domain-containing protein [Curtobacterium sp. Leaf261]